MLSELAANHVWGVQKTGEDVLMVARYLFTSPDVLQNIKRCDSYSHPGKSVK